MINATPKVAIILRGPPAVGKTEISAALLRRIPYAVRFSLDAGWAPGHRRYQTGPTRYADLAEADAPILILELACGEPVDLAFPGATQAAHDWVDLLRSQGRTLFPFLLWREWDDAARTILERHAKDGIFAISGFWNSIGQYSLYEHNHATVTLPRLPGYKEVRIITTGRSFDDVVEEIIAISGLEP